MFERTEFYVIVRGDRYDHQGHVYGTNQYDCPACCALRSLSVASPPPVADERTEG